MKVRLTAVLPQDPDTVVWTAVSELDPLERRALMLIYLGNLTRRQAAKRLREQRAAAAIAVARALRA